MSTLWPAIISLADSFCSFDRRKNGPSVDLRGETNQGDRLGFIFPNELPNQHIYLTRSSQSLLMATYSNIHYTHNHPEENREAGEEGGEIDCKVYSDDERLTQ